MIGTQGAKKARPEPLLSEITRLVVLYASPDLKLHMLHNMQPAGISLSTYWNIGYVR